VAAANFEQHMKSFVQHETVGRADLNDWQDYQMEDPPKLEMADNGCGVWILRMAEMIVRGATPFLPEDRIMLLRGRIMAQIINQDLQHPNFAGIVEASDIEREKGEEGEGGEEGERREQRERERRDRRKRRKRRERRRT
jgi:hypothetical protein